jgi:acyl carrier protein
VSKQTNHQPVQPQLAAANDACTKDTLEAMKRIAERMYGIPAAEMIPQRKLETLGFDSLAFIEYAFELEGELGITLPDLPRDLGTIGDLAKFVDAEVIRHKAAELAKGR